MMDLDKLQKLCREAMPGPWKCCDKPSFGDWFVTKENQHICLLPANKKGTYYGDYFKANALFIAEARTALPELIERVREAEKLADALQDIASLRRTDLLTDPDYWGHKVVATAAHALAEWEGSK